MEERQLLQLLQTQAEVRHCINQHRVAKMELVSSLLASLFPRPTAVYVVGDPRALSTPLALARKISASPWPVAKNGAPPSPWELGGGLILRPSRGGHLRAQQDDPGLLTLHQRGATEEPTGLDSEGWRTAGRLEVKPLLHPWDGFW